MSDDTPTAGELSRLINAIRDDQRNGFAAINARLDRLVTADLYSAEQRRVDERLKDLADDLVAEREARIRADDAERQSREKLGANLRWLAAGVVIPIALFVATLVLGR